MPKGLSKSHTAAVKDFASRNGFEFAAKFGRKELRGAAKLETFEGWTEGHNLVRGNQGGAGFQMFDMLKVVQGTDADGYATESKVTQTVVLFENSEDFPIFSLTEMRGVFSMLGLAGAMG